MAKKKKSKESSISEALGFKNMMLSERLSFMSGAILFCIAAYMIVSFISFFSTSSADISMIESPKVGEIMNTSRQFTNICGSIGAYISYFFDHYNEKEIIATIKDENVPSWKTAEKCGFELVETKMYKDIDDEKEELYRFYVKRN